MKKYYQKKLHRYVEELFSAAEDCYADFTERRCSLKEKVKGRILIIGAIAKSTTDLGINLYEDHYPNSGVHYTLMNMILSEDFVDDSPLWISVLFSLAVCLA